MEESIRDPESTAARSIWTLRHAGPQDDSNESLWAAHARSTGYSVRELLAIASRRRGLIAVVFAGIFVSAASWVWTLEPEYQVSASVIVKPASGAKAEPITAGEMVAEIGRARSLTALRNAVETHDLAKGLPGKTGEERIAEATRRLSDAMRVGSMPESGMITIQYSGHEPEQAAAVVNTLANLYVDSHRRLRAARESVRSGEDRQSAAYEMELLRAKTELEEFLRKNGTALQGYSRDGARSRSAQLAEELKSLDGRIRDSESRLDQLRLQASKAARSGAGPFVVEIAKMQTQIEDVRRMRSETVGKLEAAESLRSGMDRLTARRSELQRAVEDAEEKYVELRNDEGDAHAAEATGGRILAATLVRPATPPAKPVMAGSLPLLLLSALAAACLAIAAAALYDPRRKPVAYVADIAAAAGAPVLMMIEETQSHVS